MSLLAIQNGLTIQQAIAAPISKELVKKIGQATLHKIICAVLKLFCESLNISQSMNAIQVYETAGFWIERYPTETLKDLILCLKRAKQGNYGKIYNRFDGEVFGEFFGAYLAEKAEHRENEWRNQKAVEASDQFAMLKTIEFAMPGTMDSFTLKATPVFATTTHETYLGELSKKLPFASVEEMNRLRADAVEAKLFDVVKLIDNELTGRTPDDSCNPSPQNSEYSTQSESTPTLTNPVLPSGIVRKTPSFALKS